MDKKIIQNNRGQMAVWIILAVLLVSSMLIFLYIERRTSQPVDIITEEVNPEQFIDQCTRKNVNEAVDIMLPQGGFVNPKNTKLYNGINVTYLCLDKGSYRTCVNQHPLLITEMEAEIKNHIAPKIEACFSTLEVELEKRNSAVEMGEMNLNVESIPDKILVDIEREVTIAKNGETIRYTSFDVETLSPLYNLGRLAMEIASQEAKYCYFEYVGYMILYPEFQISKTPLSDSTDIYTLTDKKSTKQMNIAVRSCAIPAGL